MNEEAKNEYAYEELNISSNEIYKDAITQYMKDMQGNSLLSKDEITELFKRLEIADKEEIKQIKDELVRANYRLVISVAKQYRKVGLKGMSYEDLIQEGNIGLLKAIDKYDYKSGNAFSTYAVWWIRQSITRAISDKDSVIRVPVHMVELRARYNRYCNQFETKYGKKPSFEQAIEAIKLNEKSDVGLLKMSIMADSSISANTPVGEDEHGEVTELGDFFAGNEDTCKEVEDMELHNILTDFIDSYPVSERNKDIIKMRTGLEDGKIYTLEEAGMKYGITKERVRQIESKFIHWMRFSTRSKILKDFLYD